MERFAMNEFKPLSLWEKKQRIENEIMEIEKRRTPLIERKKEIELELSNLNNKVRKGNLSSEEYKKVCQEQDFFKSEKNSVERQLMQLRDEVKAKNNEKDNVHLQIKRIPDDRAKQTVLELRDKYMAFASDTTRVSSMRAMASKFVEEIQMILKDMN